MCLACFSGGGAVVQTVTWNLVYLINILYTGLHREVQTRSKWFQAQDKVSQYGIFPQMS